MLRNEKNFQLWLDALGSDNFKQGEGVLVSRAKNGVKYHCCLGVGEQLRGAAITAPEFAPVPRTLERDDGREVDVIDLKVDGNHTGLPSVAFADWLGLEVVGAEDEWDEDTADEDKEIDLVIIEKSDNVYERSPYDRHDEVGNAHEWAASELNDEGFTFKQIRDLARHFGVKAVAST